MKREPLMTEAYFRASIDYTRSTIAERTRSLDHDSGQLRKPQVLAHANFHDQCELLLSRYSVGDPVGALAGGLEAIVSSWERCLASDPSSPNDLGYIDDYVRSLWIVSLALIFRADEALWQRILACAGNEGRDRLFERLVARRTTGRRQAAALLHPKAHAFLDRAAEKASADEVVRFLKAWYPALREIGWHDCHQGPEGGGFFGYWAVEAAGVAVAFGIDDASFRDLSFYPRDLADHGRGD